MGPLASLLAQSGTNLLGTSSLSRFLFGFLQGKGIDDGTFRNVSHQVP